MKKGLLAAIIAVILMSMFTIGCGDLETENSGTNDTLYINIGGGVKQLFPIYIGRNTKDGTYSIETEMETFLYPFPKLIVNGVEANGYYDFSEIEVWVDGISAGNLTYSAIWADDTLTRTINLPNNTYTLVENHTDTYYRYSVAGGNGDEKVVWSYEYREDNYIYKSDTLSINEALVFPKTTNYSYFYCSVMHKDFKPLGPGYTATAESKKIAVCEKISLWRFQIGSH
jgi:hypothetical protein